jgi:hypothetical protein
MYSTLTWEVAILIVTGLAALIIQMVYFLFDDRAVNNTAKDRRLKLIWHAAGGAIHIWMGYAVARIANDWHAGFFMGSITWMLFDGCINSFVLKREFWYIGDTAQWDIAQRWVAGLLHIEHRAFSATLKIGTLAYSILLLIPNLL